MYKNPNRGGRPTKFSTTVVRKLEEILKAGGSISHACLCAGISRDTFYEWMNLKRRFPDKKCRKIFEEFAEKMELAQATPCLDCRKAIIKEGTKKGNWKAAAWWLEKKDPEFKESKPEITINNSIPYTCIKIVDATGDGTGDSTNKETEGTSE